MSHVSEEELNEKLHDASHQVELDERYRHYKTPSQTYIVEGLAIIEATEEVGVIYQAEYGKHLTFVRPLREWLEEVEINGETMPRFSRIY